MARMTNVRLDHGARRYSIKMQSTALANIFFMSEHEIILRSSTWLALLFFFSSSIISSVLRQYRATWTEGANSLISTRFDKLICIKIDKRAGAAPSDTLEWWWCIRFLKTVRAIDLTGSYKQSDVRIPIDHHKDSKIINTVSDHSSAHTRISC